MGLDQWDEQVGQHLAGIRLDAGWAKWSADKILERVKRLAYRPEFATEAEVQLNEAIVSMEKSLLALKEAREAYRAKQVEPH